MLHYYFSDKEDLITHCVRQYEAACVTRYDEIVATAGSAIELKREFSAAMAQTLRTDAPMHRLWYDLRNQSLFEESFRADVLEIDHRREEMIWRVISRYAEFAGITVALSPGAAYAILDGLFQQALLHQLAGDENAAERPDGERGARSGHLAVDPSRCGNVAAAAGTGKGFAAAVRLSGVNLPGPAVMPTAFDYVYRQVAATLRGGGRCVRGRSHRVRPPNSPPVSRPMPLRCSATRAC